MKCIKYIKCTKILFVITVSMLMTTNVEDLHYFFTNAALILVAFVTPEMLRTNALRKLLLNKTFKDRVCVVAVDEAHCVSEWCVLVYYNN